MTVETYSSDGPHDASSDEFIAALDNAVKATIAADQAREEAASKPGFFVVPTCLLPDL